MATPDGRGRASGRTGLAWCSAPGRCCAARAFGSSCITTKAVSGPLSTYPTPVERRAWGNPADRGSAARPESGTSACRRAFDVPGLVVDDPPRQSKFLIGSSDDLDGGGFSVACCRCHLFRVQVGTSHHWSCVWESGSSLVLCTGAVLRRPSVRLLMHHNEGCFRPAIARRRHRRALGLEQPRRSGFRGPTVSATGGGPESLRCPRSRGRRPSQAMR